MPPSTRANCVLLAALPQAVGRAREYARGVLGAWQLQAMTDTVELLVSELVTNAVQATGLAEGQVDAGTANPIYLCLSMLEELLLIEVWDTSSTVPLKRAAADDDEAGRGLMLVKALSKEWGCRMLTSGGKIVWCKCLVGETA
ncbi:MAG: putative serine/threonine kinase anti-sigma factor [Actinoallomurus sp.]|jgi:anti-sigma regulatory factor (Ser/Thr protein kinase)|nr:putative serine/threonine kinase anti-sigma factor [Actinoallomurus sp.]